MCVCRDLKLFVCPTKRVFLFYLKSIVKWWTTDEGCICVDSVIPPVSVILLTLISLQLSLSSTLWGLKATGLSSAGASMKGLQWAASCLNSNGHRLMESRHSHTVSVWFGILPQFASRAPPWCLLYVLFPCDLTTPHKQWNGRNRGEMYIRTRCKEPPN